MPIARRLAAERGSMSRHVVASRQPPLEVVVGWDFPLQTFFAQVRRPVPDDNQGDETDPVVLWLGAGFGQIPSVGELVPLLLPYAILDPDMLAQLERDASGSPPLTRLQQTMTGILRRPPS